MHTSTVLPAAAARAVDVRTFGKADDAHRNSPEVLVEIPHLRAALL